MRCMGWTIIAVFRSKERISVMGTKAMEVAGRAALLRHVEQHAHDLTSPRVVERLAHDERSQATATPLSDRIQCRHCSLSRVP
jgi:hypothetical protein